MHEDEFVAYIRSKSGLSKMFEAWIKRYEQLEYLGGSIQLSRLSKQECEDIGLFLHTFVHTSELRITYRNMCKALQASRFSECDFLTILRVYKGKDFYFKRSNLQEKENHFSVFCDTCLKQNKDKPASLWFVYMLQDSNIGRAKWKELWEIDERACIVMIEAINSLPVWKQEIQIIAEFAQGLTKDPHYFDYGLSNYILLHAIYAIFQNGIEPKTTIEKAECLLQAGLLKDDTSNFCIICHLHAFQDDITHDAWRTFYNTYEPWMVNVYNIQNVTKIVGDKHIYIVENPSTFRMLSLFVKEHCLPFSVVCTYGQPNLCAYLLLNKLSESEIPMYYAGDFDPEGILIADTLKRRYPSLILWHYHPTDYEHAISNKEISVKRLRMLSKCSQQELKILGTLLMERKLAGYQESLHDYYKADLLKSSQNFLA